MNIQEINNKRLGGTLPETSNKKQKTGNQNYLHISSLISPHEDSNMVIDPSRVNLGTNDPIAEHISNQYDLMVEYMFPGLSRNEILSLRSTWTHWKSFVETLLTERINNKEISLSSFGFQGVDEVAAFFDKNCSKMQVLDLTGFKDVISADIEDILDFFPNVEELVLSEALINVSFFVFISRMPNLKKLELKNCGWGCNEKFPKSVGQIPTCDQDSICLEDLESCSSGLGPLGCFPNLQELVILSSETHSDLFSLISEMKNLKKLDFQLLDDLDSLYIDSKSLEQIKIHENNDIHSFVKIGKITIDCFSLQKLSFEDTMLETDTINLNCPALKELKFGDYDNHNTIENFTLNCHYLEDLSDFIHCDIKNLNLNCPAAKALHIIARWNNDEVNYNCPWVEDLNMKYSSCKNINLFCPSLKKFNIRTEDTDCLESLNFFSSIDLLENFSFAYAPKISLQGDLPSLSTLVISDPSDFSLIEKCPQLIELDLSEDPYSKHISSISFLRDIPKLETFKLGSCFGIQDISILSEISTLKYLEIPALDTMDKIAITPNTNFESIFNRYAEVQRRKGSVPNLEF